MSGRREGVVLEQEDEEVLEVEAFPGLREGEQEGQGLALDEDDLVRLGEGIGLFARAEE